MRILKQIPDYLARKLGNGGRVLEKTSMRILKQIPDYLAQTYFY